MAADTPFDAPLASTLLPSLVKLAQLAADASSVSGTSNGDSGDAAGDTDTARNAKVEISKQVRQPSTLAHAPAHHLVLDRPLCSARTWRHCRLRLRRFLRAT